MIPQLPGVTESLDHLWFSRQVLILSILNLSTVHEWLEVRSVLNSVRRIEIDHLHMTGHALLFEQGIHDQQAVTGEHPVTPPVGVLIKLDGFAERWVFRPRTEK